MNDRLTRRPSLSGHAVTTLGVLASTCLIATGCETNEPAAPGRAEFTAASHAAGPAVIDLWGGSPGGYASAINQAGVVVGRNWPQILIWDHGTLIQVGTPCSSSACVVDHFAPIGINAKGQVAGTLRVRAFLWDKGTLTNLGPFFSFASWINDAGDVLGGVGVCGPPLPKYVLTSEMCSFHAVLWRNGSPIDLGTLGGNYSSPAGINSAGEVAGTAELAHADLEPGDVHAFFWKDGKMTDLGTLGGPSSAALGINSAGQVVGLAETPDSVKHAVLWDHGTTTDLGEGTACAINAGGQIVGVSGGSAVVWDHGTRVELGVPTYDCVFPFTPYGGFHAPTVNASGDVALTSCTGSYSNCSAYLWSKGMLTKLIDLAGNNAVVYGMNARGWLIGQSITASGESHGVLWTP